MSALASDLQSSGRPTPMAVPGSQWAAGRPEFLAICGPSARVTSQFLVLPLPLLSSFDLMSRTPGESQGSPPLLPGGPRHSHLFFVSRMNRRKRRPSTRNMLCRRPRRSARCRHPTCRLSSESTTPVPAPRAAVLTASCHLKHCSSSEGTYSVPGNVQQQKQRSLCSQGAFIAASEIDNKHPEIIFNCDHRCQTSRRNRSWVGCLRGGALRGGDVCVRAKWPCDS